MNADPLVTVVIATYNWSSVLHYAIQSVLWQTFQDWELLVIGDACTDDSEQVVVSFGDPRIHWHNLPENSGSQSGPNNKGIELARGRYVAYLGHDDLWYFDHLEKLVGAMRETGCDFSFSITAIVRPNPDENIVLYGLSSSGQYEHGVFAPPSSWMHKTSLVDEIGGWRDYRAIRSPVDVDFLFRAHEAGKTISIVNALTVIKFPSALRKDSYLIKSSREQEHFADRILHDKEFRYRELMKFISHPSITKKLFKDKFTLSGKAEHGAIAQHNREMRGLPRTESITPEPEAPLPLNVSLLKLLNHKDDIGPLAGRISLFTASELPSDGLFIGVGWHGIEQDMWGQFFRWAADEVEIIVTRPTGQRRHLVLDIAPGPGVNDQPFDLEIMDEAGMMLASATVAGRSLVEIELPIQAGDGGVFRLHSVGGGRLIETDPRVLNFVVYQLGWVEPSVLQARKDRVDLQATCIQNEDLKRANAEIQQALATAETALAQAREERQQTDGAMAQQLQFRQTSLRYWLLRARTSPKLRRLLRLAQ